MNLDGLNTESIFNILNNFDNQTQIAKAEPTVKPKKTSLIQANVDNEIVYSSGQNIFSQKTSNSDGCFVATENAKLAAIRKLIKKKGINSKGVIANGTCYGYS